MIIEVFDMFRQTLQYQMYVPVNLDYLFELAYILCIRIEFRDLHAQHPQMDAFTRDKLIVIDKSFEYKRRSLKCLLAEEIGHVLFPPTADQGSYHLSETWLVMQCSERDSLEVRIGRDERHALRFAADTLIPEMAFWGYAATGPHELHEWLDYFEVKQWLFEYRVGYIRASQPVQWRLKWREILKRK